MMAKAHDSDWRVATRRRASDESTKGQIIEKKKSERKKEKELRKRKIQKGDHILNHRMFNGLDVHYRKTLNIVTSVMET